MLVRTSLYGLAMAVPHKRRCEIIEAVDREVLRSQGRAAGIWRAQIPRRQETWQK